MSYLIFARKFRPQTFEEVVGQEAITTTLKNAIRQERVPQSFLFSGPRGVGKTSTARILAKALNCSKGPIEEPCGKCIACKEIEQGNSMDVLEIDGASNRGIEEIRNLRESVKFKPTAGHFKIYIIDEVHMLTAEAFNALLKTLEEPPLHVKFIFATTEPHKVPLTILSRCQRFPFKRISVSEVVKKLEEIAQKEKLKFEKNALFLIAKSTEGALRDAESLLDQLASFSEGKIKEEDVLTLLGISADKVYLSVLTAIRAKKGDEVFRLVKKLYEEGGDLAQFAKGLFEIFRHLLILKSVQKAEDFVEANEDTLKELKKHSQNFSQNELLLALAILQNLQYQLRRPVASPKLLVETALLKLTYLDTLRSVEELMEKAASPHGAGPETPVPLSKTEKKSHKPKTPDSNSEPSGKTSVPTIQVRQGMALNAGEEDQKNQNISPLQKETNGLTLDDAEKVWAQVIELVKIKRMSTSLFLAEAEPIEVEGGVIVLGLPAEFRFHKETLEKPSNYTLVEEAFSKTLGRKVRVQFVVTKTEGETRSVAKAPEPQAQDSGLSDIISQTLEIFDGAKIVRKE